MKGTKVFFIFFLFFVISTTVSAESLNISLRTDTVCKYSNATGTLNFYPGINYSNIDYKDFTLHTACNVPYVDGYLFLNYYPLATSQGWNVTMNESGIFHLETRSASPYALQEMQYFKLNSTYQIRNNSRIGVSNSKGYAFNGFTAAEFSFYSNGLYVASAGISSTCSYTVAGLYCNETSIYTGETIEFDAFSFGKRGYHPSSGSYVLYDSIYFSNITDLGTNELPECDYKVDNYLKCLNSSIVSFGIDLDCTDAENDTLYYATRSEHAFELYSAIDFDDYHESLYNTANYFLYCVILGSVTPIGGTDYEFNGLCDPYNALGVSADFSEEYLNLTNEPISESLYDMTEQNKTVFWKFERDNNYMPCINASKIESDGNLIVYDDSIGFVDRQMSFAIEMENGGSGYIYADIFNFWETMAPIYINRSNDLTTIYHNGSLIHSSSEEKLEFRIDLALTTDNEYTLYVSDSSSYDYANPDYVGVFSTDKDKPTLFDFQAVTGTTCIDDVLFFKLNTTFDWVTTTPTEFTYYVPAQYNPYIFVTDDVHKDNDKYMTYDFLLTVLDNSSSACSIQAADFFNATDLLIGNAVEDYFKTLGLQKQLEKFLYVLFFGLMIFFIVTFFKSTGTIKISVNLILSSIICFVPSWLAKLQTPMIVFLLLFSIGLSMLFLSTGEL